MAPWQRVMDPFARSTRRAQLRDVEDAAANAAVAGRHSAHPFARDQDGTVNMMR